MVGQTAIIKKSIVWGWGHGLNDRALQAWHPEFIPNPLSARVWVLMPRDWSAGHPGRHLQSEQKMCF
jgi:hypothetical protein